MTYMDLKEFDWRCWRISASFGPSGTFHVGIADFIVGEPSLGALGLHRAEKTRQGMKDQSTGK